MNPLEEPGRLSRLTDPCILVIFGATGDLTGRRLLPAIYQLGKEGLLPSHFACVGFARRPKSHEEFRKEMKEDVSVHGRTKPIDEAFWTYFQEQIFYHRAEFDSDEGYRTLARFLAQIDSQHQTKGNRIFYLSVPPKYFSVIIEKLHQFHLIYEPRDNLNRWSRIIVEKPFGRDLTTSAQLQSSIQKHLDESQIYRIDHYLGKETVQNLLAFRFANSIFESIWNCKQIDHVQITVAEEIGIGSRGAFFEEEGIVRDVIQNHMMQLLSLVAMEPPTNLSASAVRDEKVKVLQSIRPWTQEELSTCAVRGQYGKGYIHGEPVCGYREEANVNLQSMTETYAAIRLFIDNWRWASVPFYLRSGKRLPKRATEIAVRFKDVPGFLFQDQKIDPNVLTIRIQPNEGIALKINCKVPGPSTLIQPVKMDFRYGSYFGQPPPEAYERLILDCITGDNTLFARSDEVAASWKILTPLLNHWAEEKPSFPDYSSGTWGPVQADEMLARDHRTWRIL
jgi:glucose-6-phosphate 1-dehydrogenase